MPFSECLFDGSQQIVIGFERRQFRIVFLDLFGAAEQESCLACLDHCQIVVAVAAGNRFIANGLECLNGGQL